MDHHLPGNCVFRVDSQEEEMKCPKCNARMSKIFKPKGKEIFGCWRCGSIIVKNLNNEEE